MSRGTILSLAVFEILFVGQCLAQSAPNSSRESRPAAAKTLAIATESRTTDVPPLFRTGERILFQGDSITDGNRGRSGDQNHILGHGYAFILAARHGAAYPEAKLQFYNRGVSGDRLAELEKRWDADTLQLRPTVVSVLVGINDVNTAMKEDRTIDVPTFERTYDMLLATTKANSPRVRFVLLEPFVAPGTRNSSRFKDWSNSTAELQAAVRRLAKKHDAAFVSLQEVFEQASKRAPTHYWIWDGVHPTYAGHQLIADAWETAFAKHFGDKPSNDFQLP